MRRTGKQNSTQHGRRQRAFAADDDKTGRGGDLSRISLKDKRQHRKQHTLASRVQKILGDVALDGTCIGFAEVRCSDCLLMMRSGGWKVYGSLLMWRVAAEVDEE